MEDLNRGIRRVHSLTTGPPGTAHFYPNVFGPDFNIDIFGFWQHSHCRGRSVDTALSFSHRDTLHTMNTAFISQYSKDGLPAHLKDNFLETTQFRRASFQFLDLKAMSFGNVEYIR